MAKKKAAKKPEQTTNPLPDEPERRVEGPDDLPEVDAGAETLSEGPPPEISANADVDPDVAARDARMHTILQTLARHGVIVSQQQFLLQSDETISTAHRWVDAVLADPDRDPPPIPLALLDYATRELRERIAPAPDKRLPPRKFLACTFGKVGAGDQTASMPVRVEKDRLTPDEADELLCGRRLEVVIVLEENNERDQERIEELAPPRIVTICDIKSYRVAVKYWAFGLTFSLQEIDGSDLLEFAYRTGRIELQLLGDADDDESIQSPGEQPHPDVEMGKDRPHGTPAVEALAKVAGPSLFDRHESDEVTVPINSEQLKLGLPQLAASLRQARAESVPLPDLFHTWTEEVRDEVDTWAKTVVSHASGDKSLDLPSIPEVIREHLPPEQRSHPVGYVKASKKWTPITWQCLACERNWALSKPRVCTGCESKGDEVVLVGFYGEPAVCFDGCFIGPDVEEFQVLPETKDVFLSVRLVQGADSRWRSALHLEFTPESGERESVNDWPTIRDTGFVDGNQSIASVIGKLIDRWQPLAGDRREMAVAALKEYLGRIEAGEEPLALEQALPNTQGAEHW